MEIGPFEVSIWVLLWGADVALRFVILGWPRMSDAVGNYRGGTAMYLFPGILAEAKNQFAPVREALQPFGRLFYANFDLSRAVFSPWLNRRRFARQIIERDTKYQFDNEVMIGCSMGAAVAMDVNDELHRIAPLRRKPGLIVFDGIGGSENLLNAFNFFAPVFKWLRFLPIGFFCALPLSTVAMIVISLFVNQLPKDDEIEEGLDKEVVKRKAKRDMSWYQASVLARELVYMHDTRVTPERLAKFAWVVYFEYTDHNVTLSQPAERKKWAEMARRAGVEFALWPIETPHVAFAQMPTINRKMILQAMQLPPCQFVHEHK